MVSKESKVDEHQQKKVELTLGYRPEHARELETKIDASHFMRTFSVPYSTDFNIKKTMEVF